ncbi:MAG TPA: hypothetical protein VGM88_31910 [Kofleriaceae bacterium]|jgi:cysteine synthase
MKTLSLVLLASLSLVGCKKKDEAAAPAGSGSGSAVVAAAAGADCTAAIDSGMAKSKDQMMKVPGMTPERLQQLHDLGVQHCKDDKWAPETLKCMVDAKTEAEDTACYQKLTAEQQKKMNEAAMAMMSPPAPAGSGSDGSAAGSGSAAGDGSAAGSGSGH